MEIHLLTADLFVTEHPTRLPFRFGAVTLERAALVTAMVTVESAAGGRTLGFAADLAVPKWFAKDPAKSLRRDGEELVESALAAANLLLGEGGARGTVFDIWWRLYGERVRCLAHDAPDALIRGFGVALLERALMDAACRAGGRSFHQALREDLFGFVPGRVRPELAGWKLADSLPAVPRDRITVRHTVGLLDPIRMADIPVERRVADGLPQALEEDVARYGLRSFKVKVGGDVEADRHRLLALARWFSARSPETPRFTLDGNEQYGDLAALTALLDGVEAEPEGAALLQGLLFIEQPLPRALSLDPRALAGVDRITSRWPLLLDEADTSLDAFPRALALGWRGVSIKNCKGVFRALINRGLCELAGSEAFQSAEDLCNLGVLPLQQYLATLCALDCEHAEMNGHHYFRGLDHLPPLEVEQALEGHPDLYTHMAGGAALKVVDGEVECGSIHAPGYGHDMEILVGSRQRAEEWLRTGEDA